MTVFYRNGEYYARKGEDFATGVSEHDAKTRLMQTLKKQGRTANPGRYRRATLVQDVVAKKGREFRNRRKVENRW